MSIGYATRCQIGLVGLTLPNWLACERLMIQWQVLYDGRRHNFLADCLLNIGNLYYRLKGGSWNDGKTA